MRHSFACFTLALTFAVLAPSQSTPRTGVTHRHPRRDVD